MKTQEDDVKKAVSLIKLNHETLRLIFLQKISSSLEENLTTVQEALKTTEFPCKKCFQWILDSRLQKQYVSDINIRIVYPSDKTNII